ncbi:MAG: alanine racemase [Kocuria sp.]|nr:alanine racemase [Kocuria sp.]
MVSLSVRKALQGMDGPIGVIDRDALDANIEALRERAGGLPIRVASKSLRIPGVMSYVLARPGFRGIMAFSLEEALALVEKGCDDVLVAYPTTNRPGLRRLAANRRARERITLTVDSSEHLDFVEKYIREGESEGSASALPPVRLCLEVDASLRIWEKVLADRVHLGARRSPVRTPEQALDIVRQISRRPHIALVGILSYEGQIAGQANAGKGLKAMVTRRMQGMSVDELKDRRTRVIAAVREEQDLEFVNGGGTGSLETSTSEGTLTELGAGSGLLSPGLFDGYQQFHHRPAAFIATPVVRRPAPGWVTVFEGGWIASGPPGADRAPTIAWPEGLKYSPTEGPGEVQTPLRGPGAETLGLGDLVYFRHAKAGELAEHLPEYQVVSGGRILETWKNYRGEGWAF